MFFFFSQPISFEFETEQKANIGLWKVSRGERREREREKGELFSKSRSLGHKSEEILRDWSDPKDPKDRDNEERGGEPEKAPLPIPSLFRYFPNTEACVPFRVRLINSRRGI